MNAAEAINWALRHIQRHRATLVPADGWEDTKATQADKPSPHSSQSTAQLIKRLLKAFPPREGFRISQVAGTNSMEPMIDANSVVVLERLTPAILERQPLLPGDVVIYTNGGMEIIHELISETTFLGKPAWLIKGRNNFLPDGKIPTDRILWRMVGAMHGRQQRDGD